MLREVQKYASWVSPLFLCAWLVQPEMQACKLRDRRRNMRPSITALFSLVQDAIWSFFCLHSNTTHCGGGSFSSHYQQSKH